jgi:hypothetical protein
MDKCLKFKHEIETVITPYKEMYKDMQKKEKHWKMASFSLLSPPLVMHSDHHDNFQSRILSALQ